MFIDEWFDKDFYEQLPVGHIQPDKFIFGQVFRTHAYYPHENLQLWRPVIDPTEPTKTIARDFNIQAAGNDAFKRAYPLQVPRLETNEEFIVIRAKRRPVLLIRPETPFTGVNNKGYSGKVQRKLCWVAQVFGLSDPVTKQPTFNQAFIDRVRRMEFPELMFLPQKAGVFEVDSLLRLDEFQSVFMPHLESTGFALGKDVRDTLLDQIKFLVAGTGPSPYTLLREELLAS